VSETAFTGKLVRTTNVAKELIAISKESGIAVADLDIRLIKDEIYTKLDDPDKKEENNDFKELSSEDKGELESRENLINPNYFIKQIYDVEIFPKEEEEFPKLDLNISANKSLTSVYAIIKAGSIIEKSDKILESLTDYFIKRKLRTHILINLWDKELVNYLAKLAAEIEVHGMKQFKKDEKILVMHSLGAKAQVDDNLILHFEEKQKNQDDYGRIDYKQRGFITAVEENELLITYMKPKEGENGRNCRGVYMEIPAPDTSHASTFGVKEDSILVQEEDDKILYKAKCSNRRITELKKIWPVEFFRNSKGSIH
jgi:hypothetical protein